MLLAILTVSDRCSRGQMEDTSGPAVVEILRRQFPGSEVEAGLVPDDAESIAARLEGWCQRSAALVVTTGGTGFGPRDVTPEATLRVIDRAAPGLAEAMRAGTAQINPLAWLSRGVAGLKGSTLIVNLPGSRRGAEECLGAILPLIEHALQIAAGGQHHPG